MPSFFYFFSVILKVCEAVKTIKDKITQLTIAKLYLTNVFLIIINIKLFNLIFKHVVLTYSMKLLILLLIKD